MNLNQYQIAALKFIESKGITFYEEMQSQLRFEIPKHAFKEMLESLTHYNLIEDCTEPGKEMFIRLSAEGKNQLKIHERDSLSRLRDVKPTYQKVNVTPNKNESAIPKTSWYNKPLFTSIIWPLLVGLLLLAFAIYLSKIFGLSA
jgi:hypothetical protein